MVVEICFDKNNVPKELQRATTRSTIVGYYAEARATDKPRNNLYATATVDPKAINAGAIAIATPTSSPMSKRDDIAVWMAAGAGLAEAVDNTLL